MSMSDEPYNVIEDIDPVFVISAVDLEDNLYGTELANKLRQKLVGGGDWYWKYNFDSSSYKLIPIPRSRVGFGVWIAKPYEYSLRIGILVDRHQLRIYCWRWVVVFGVRDIDLLIEAHAP